MLAVKPFGGYYDTLRELLAMDPSMRVIECGGISDVSDKIRQMENCILLFHAEDQSELAQNLVTVRRVLAAVGEPQPRVILTTPLQGAKIEEKCRQYGCTDILQGKTEPRELGEMLGAILPSKEALAEEATRKANEEVFIPSKDLPGALGAPVLFSDSMLRVIDEGISEFNSAVNTEVKADLGLNDGPKLPDANKRTEFIQPKLHPITLAFLLADLMGKNGADARYIARRYCQYLNNACGDACIELWALTNKRQWLCIGANSTHGGIFLKEVELLPEGSAIIQDRIAEKDTPYGGFHVITTPILGPAKNLVGALVLAGRCATEISPSYMVAVSTIAYGLVEYFANPVSWE